MISVMMPFEAARGASVLYLIVWYFSSDRTQAKFVKEKFGKDYKKRGWLGPVFAGIGILIVIVFLSGIFAGPIDA